MTSWTTDDELAFLSSKLPAFRALGEGKRYGKVKQFINTLLTSFIAVFPLKDDETLEQKREQLRAWMNWHSKNDTTNDKRRVEKSTKVDPHYAKLINAGRKLQDVEVYQKTFPEKIRERVKEEISKEEDVNRADKMRIRRKVVSELWKEDKDKADVLEEINVAKKRQAEADLKAQSGERTPEQYQKALAGMPNAVAKFMEMLAKETGWLFLVYGTGPNPSDDGRIYLKKFEFGGDKNPPFHDSHSELKGAFELSLVEYANRRFPNDICQARTINTQADNSSEDGRDSAKGQEESARETAAAQEEPAPDADADKEEVDVPPSDESESMDALHTHSVDDPGPENSVDNTQHNDTGSDSIQREFTEEGHAPAHTAAQVPIGGFMHSAESQLPPQPPGGPTESMEVGLTRNMLPPESFAPGTDYFVQGATVRSPLAADRATKSRGRGSRRGQGPRGRGRRAGGRGDGRNVEEVVMQPDAEGSTEPPAANGRKRKNDGRNVEEVVMQPDAEESTEPPAANGRKRKNDDKSPCEVITKRVRRAARDPLGNEYVMQTRGRRGGQR